MTIIDGTITTAIQKNIMYLAIAKLMVGGGSAGSVVVNRLTENAEWSVLLLEAGSHETEITDVPSFSLHIQKTKLDWQYRTQAQDSACQAMKDNRCCWPCGKVLLLE
ncbi:hypothetical protein V1478_013685 [Vespula squamosa]|uniref:Glucose-methanol-choline oxidoreductase N-terminal domain-containing protein n=1 Tax=Vespula squamosa TaxID=30214 RepID=A0ABD2A5U2_VESSQ